MNKILKLRAYLNKKNKQITLNIPKKEMPYSLRKKVSQKPFDLKFLKVQLEDFE